MSAIDRALDAFEQWLEDRGKPPADRSIAHGILMQSGSGLVADKHIEEAMALASEAGFGDEMLGGIAEQGALLREFQADMGHKAVPTTSSVYIIASPSTTDEKLAPVAPRASLAAENAPDVAASSDGPQPTAAAPASISRRATVIAAVSGVAVLAVVAGLWHMATSSAPAKVAKPRQAQPAATEPARSFRSTVVRGSHLLFDLDHVAMQLELPLGWQYAEEAEGEQPGPLGGTIRTSLLFEGDTIDAARQTLFLASTDLPPALEDQLPLADDMLLSLAQFVEYEIAHKVQADGIYKQGKCEVVKDILGRRAGVCDGYALSLNETATVHTYVRLESGRALFALFVADESIEAPHRIADATIESLR